jgi:hypothetical protein
MYNQTGIDIHVVGYLGQGCIFKAEFPGNGIQGQNNFLLTYIFNTVSSHAVKGVISAILNNSWPL